VETVISKINLNKKKHLEKNQGVLVGMTGFAGSGQKPPVSSLHRRLRSLKPTSCWFYLKNAPGFRFFQAVHSASNPVTVIRKINLNKKKTP